MLKAGSKAPNFTLPDQEQREISLSDLLQPGPVILYFYPADFTPGCTRQACSSRDLHEAIVSAGLGIVGISPQDSASHQRFREQYDLPFSLLSDKHKSVIRKYGVDGPFGVGVRRASFLVDKAGSIQATLRADFRVRRHEEFLRKAIESRNREPRR
ncbi:MAG: peroxiredoxin [Woeseia sp.]